MSGLPEPLAYDALITLSAEEWRARKPAEIGILAQHVEPERLEAYRPLSAFKPSPRFWPLIALAFDLPPGLRYLVRAGNRAGKSEHGAAFLVLCALLRRGSYRAVGVTYRQMIEVVGKLLYELIPPRALARDSVYTATRGWRNNLIRLKNGSTIQLKSYDQDAQAHAGAPLDGAWLDEPPPEPIYTETVARLHDREGFLLITATPLDQPVAYLRELVALPDSPWQELVVSFAVDSCPWYTAEQIAARIKECALTPATFGQRIHGDWEGVTVARRFDGYDPTRHDRARPDLAKLVTSWRIGIDHGNTVKPDEPRQLILLSGQVAATKEIHVFGEFGAGELFLTPPQIAAGISRLLDSQGLDRALIIGRLKIYGDSNSAGLGKASPTRFNDEIARELKKLGVNNPILSPVKVQGTREDDEALINGLLHDDRLTIDPSAVTLRRALAHYQGKERHKDIIDALRYGLHDLLTERLATATAAEWADAWSTL